MILQEDKMPLAMKEFLILQKAVATWGEEAQLNMVIEEAAELIVSINHYRRGRDTWQHVLEEMADTQILIDQFSVIGDNAKIMNESRAKKNVAT